MKTAGSSSPIVRDLEAKRVSKENAFRAWLSEDRLNRAVLGLLISDEWFAKHFGITIYKVWEIRAEIRNQFLYGTAA